MTTPNDLKSTQSDSSGKPTPPPLPAKRATKSSAAPIPASATAPDTAERRLDYNKVYMNFSGNTKHFASAPALTWQTFFTGCKEELPLLASWLVLIIYLGSTYCRNAEQVKLLRGEVTYNKQNMEALIDEQSKKSDHYFQTTMKMGEDLSAQKLHVEEIEAHWKFLNDKQTAAIEKLRTDIETTNRLIASRNLTPAQPDAVQPVLTQAATPAPASTDVTAAAPAVSEPEKNEPTLSVNDATITNPADNPSPEEAASNDPLVAANREKSNDSEQK